MDSAALTERLRLDDREAEFTRWRLDGGVSYFCEDEG